MSEMLYKREVSPSERAFRYAPYAIVTVVARIKGNVSEEMLKNAATLFSSSPVRRVPKAWSTKSYIPRSFD